MSNEENLADKSSAPDSPDQVRNLVKKLDNDDQMVRIETRTTLIKLGRPAVKYLAEIVAAKKDRLRWEAIKTLADIEDLAATPYLIAALDDENSGIQWLAAEGLIRLGPEIVEPLLSALIGKTDSLLFLHGVHHIIHDLRDQLPPEFGTLMEALRSTTKAERGGVIAAEILRKMRSSS